jgi:hypothetical protein
VDSAHPPRVAVVPTRNGLRWLPKCLSSVTSTDYHNLDMYFVCSDASLRGLPSATNTRAVNNGPDSLLVMVILKSAMKFA